MKKSTTLIAATTTAVAALIAGTSIASADDLSKTPAPGARQLKTVQAPVPGTQAVERIAGVDRYETAVKISQNAWTPDTTVAVYLATGENFPDALAAGASTGLLGPVLLTLPHELPQVVRAELQRLEPCQIFVLGGNGTVSDNVAMWADAYTHPEHCDF